MRITTPQITAMMHGSMNLNAERLGKLMQQMATGKRMLLPSDDPISSVRVLRVQREEASLTQYRENMARLSDSLSKQEANLSSMADTMLRVQDLVLWAANLGTHSAEELAAMARELRTLEDSLVSFANVRDEEGRYLFSGTQSDAEAVIWNAVTNQYEAGGNDELRRVPVANGVLMEENVTLIRALGPNLQILNDIRQLVEMLENPALDPGDPAVAQRIQDTLQTLEEGHRGVTGAITELGGRQNSLTLIRDSNESASLVNQKIEGELSSLDYAKATIDFTNYQLALEATQKTYLRIHELSLFAKL